METIKPFLDTIKSFPERISWACYMILAITYEKFSELLIQKCET